MSADERPERDEEAGTERGPENEPTGDEAASAGRESAEESQTPADSGAPPVPEEGTKPGGEQAAEEVAGSQERDAGTPEDTGLGHGEREVGTPEDAQPGEVEVPKDLRAEIERLMSLYPEKRSASIPALHAIQQRYGWCTPEGIEQAAAVMDLEPAYLEGVASFYDLFHLEPAGEHRVLVCTNISCWMRGADELLDAFCAATGADREHAGHGGAVSAAGDVFVSGFECLGACDVAPMAAIDERYYGPLETADAETVIGQLRDGAEVLPDKALAKRPAAGGPEPDPDPRVAEVE
jgi:NADH-quinone oxidoreductase subunit E